jgi:excisionase family DNA binding protein
MPGLPQLMRVRTVADALDLEPKQVYELIREGELKAVRLGKRNLRVCQDSVEEFIEKRRIEEDGKS